MFSKVDPVLRQRLDDARREFNGASWAHFNAQRQGSSRIGQIERRLQVLGERVRHYERITRREGQYGA